MGRRGEICQYWLEFSRLAVDEQLWDFCIICGGFVWFLFEEFCFSFYSIPFFLIKLCLSQPMRFCTFALPVFSPSQWWMGSEPAAVWYLNCLLGLNHDITSVRLWRFIKMKSWKVCWLTAECCKLIWNSILDSHMLSRAASGMLYTFLYTCFKSLLAYLETSPYSC